MAAYGGPVPWWRVVRADGVEDEDGAGQQTTPLAVSHRDPVVGAEAGAERRPDDQAVDAFGAAEAGDGEREVLGDGDDLGVLQAGGQFVERLDARLAHA